MGCLKPAVVYNLYTVGCDGADVHIFTFCRFRKAVAHADSMKWSGRKWIIRCTPDYPDFEEMQVWEKVGI